MNARAPIKLSGSFAGLGESAGRTFRGTAAIALRGDGTADATVAVQYSDDEGGSWHGLSIDLEGTPASWAITANLDIGVLLENEIAGRQFRFACTSYAAGSVAYDLKSRG